MPRIIPSASVACAAALLLLCACDISPKHKMSSGKFPEWETYEKKHFHPSDGTIAAIDTGASTVTLRTGKDLKVYPVTSSTRIIHEGTDITLAQLPLNQSVKFSLSTDGQRLLSVWYGERLYTYHPGHLNSAAHGSPSP